MSKVKPPAGKITPVSVPLQLSVLKDPPISELSLFEFGVMAAVVLAAAKAWFANMHEQSWQASSRRMRADKNRIREAKEIGDLPFSKDEVIAVYERAYSGFGRRPKLRGEVLVRAKMTMTGKRAYRQRHQRLVKQGAPDFISVETSPSALLTSVGLARNSRTRRELDAAFDRLLDPLGKYPLPPLLDEWQHLRSGRRRLTINGAWLRPRFRQVALPLPLRSTATLALYLWLRALPTSAINTRSISLVRLCRRLGITTQRGYQSATRQLEQALTAVNDHLASLSNKAVKAHHAEQYWLIDDDGRIRFQAVQDRGRDYDDDDDIEVKRPMGRRRLSPKARRQLRAQIEQAEQAEALASVTPIPLGWKPNRQTKQWRRLVS